jgi:hypothetical protein
VAHRKTLRRQYRPGGGEYVERPEEGFSAANYLRGRFMTTAFEVISDLELELRAIYENSEIKSGLDRLRLKGGTTNWDARFKLERAILKPWSQRWNLSHDWCTQWVSIQKIGRWYEVDQRELPGLGRWETIEIGHPRRFSARAFHMTAWDPTEKTESEFKAEIRNNMDSVLDAYCIEVKRQIESIMTWRTEANEPAPHYKRAPKFRQPAHFRWLVAYQLCGASLKSIANELGVDRHSVQLAIRNLAREIGLTLRPSRDYKAIASGQLRALLSPVE